MDLDECKIGEGQKESAFHMKSCANEVGWIAERKRMKLSKNFMERAVERMICSLEYDVLIVLSEVRLKIVLFCVM